MGHEVAVLQSGRLVQVADPVTLYRRPQSIDLARFVGEAVLLPGVAANGYVTCIWAGFGSRREHQKGRSKF